MSVKRHVTSIRPPASGTCDFRFLSEYRAYEENGFQHARLVLGCKKAVVTDIWGAVGVCISDEKRVTLVQL